MSMSPLEISIWPKQVHYGVGGTDLLADIVRRLGGSRALVLCGKTVAGGPMLQMVRKGLGDVLVGVFDKVEGHTPIPLVKEAAQMAKDLRADVVVSVGGGSAIDCGKGVCILTATEGDLTPFQVRKDANDKAERAALPKTILHIAVPTTAGSASDVMPSAGLRDPVAKTKNLFWDDELIPHATILDPRMAIYTGPVLTAATGMTVVARCVEALYSKNRHPLSTGLALHGLRLMRRALPILVKDPENLAARGDTQIACVMSGIAAINAMVSIVHSVGHVVGGKFALQHGLSHSILLAPAMRLLLPTMGEEQKLVCDAMGGDSRGLTADQAGEEAARQMEILMSELPLKPRLRDLGLAEEELPGLAAYAAKDYMMVNIPIPLDAPKIEAFIRSVW
jgi:alcohol dehydrogenase class IV